MKRLLRKHEAKRTTASLCAEGTLHKLLRKSLHAPQVLFTEKSTSWLFSVKSALAEEISPAEIVSLEK